MDKVEKGLQKVANHLEEQMYKLQRLVEKPRYEDLKSKHQGSVKILENLIEIDNRIARQRIWLRSNLNASPEEKSKVKSRLEEMKKTKSKLIDEYTQLQLP